MKTQISLSLLLLKLAIDELKCTARIAPSPLNQCPTCCPLCDNLAGSFLYQDPFNSGDTILEIMGK
jgi:hypothetical protein